MNINCMLFAKYKQHSRAKENKSNQKYVSNSFLSKTFLLLLVFSLIIASHVQERNTSEEERRTKQMKREKGTRYVIKVDTDSK